MAKRFLIAAIALQLLGNEIIGLAVLVALGCVGIPKLLQLMYEGGFY